MKNKLLIGTSIILLLVSFVALPVDTSAKTIQEFENEVSKYTKQLEEKKANLARNNEEVQQIIKKIKNIESRRNRSKPKRNRKKE